MVIYQLISGISVKQIKTNIMQMYTPKLTLYIKIYRHNLPWKIWIGIFFRVRCEFSQLSLATAPQDCVKPLSYGIFLPEL